MVGVKNIGWWNYSQWACKKSLVQRFEPSVQKQARVAQYREIQKKISSLSIQCSRLALFPTDLSYVLALDHISLAPCHVPWISACYQRACPPKQIDMVLTADPLESSIKLFLTWRALQNTQVCVPQGLCTSPEPSSLFATNFLGCSSPLLA